MILKDLISQDNKAANTKSEETYDYCKKQNKKDWVGNQNPGFKFI